MSPKFVCVETSAKTHSAEDNEYWTNLPSTQPLLDLGADSPEEVRKNLNAYLASPDARAHYGTKKDGKDLGPMLVGHTTMGPYVTQRNGHCWEWSFEIVPFEESLVPKIQPAPLPAPAYDEMCN